MSEEQSKAAFYQQHKDDPEIWGEPEEDAPPARRRSLSATITVRFSPEEASAIREVARDLDASYSEIVRLSVRKFVQFRLSAGKTERVKPEEGHDFSLSNATTSTTSFSIAQG